MLRLVLLITLLSINPVQAQLIQNSSTPAPAASPTFTGTVTLPDGSTSNSSGLTIASGKAFVAPSITIGSGTTITKIVVYSQSLTPAASAAALGSYEEEFTVTGVATGDKIFVNGPAPTGLCPMVAARVSDTNKVKLTFATLSALACTPVAGTYTILALRS